MKVKKEYLLLILITVALSIYLVVQRTNYEDPELPRLAELDSNTINRMLIAKADTSIELAKKDEQWLIKPQDYPANTVTVTNMLNAAAKLTTNSRNAGSASHWGTFFFKMPFSASSKKL